MRAVILAALLLAGCVPDLPPPAAQLRKPNPDLMVPPPELPEVTEGEDLFLSNGTCSAEYVLQTGRLKGLQQYVTTIHKKR